MVINIEIVLVLNKDKNIPKFNKFFLIYFSNILKLSYNSVTPSISSLQAVPYNLPCSVSNLWHHFSLVYFYIHMCVYICMYIPKYIITAWSVYILLLIFKITSNRKN